MKLNGVSFIYKITSRQRMMAGGLLMLLAAYVIYSLIIPPQLLNLKAVQKQYLTQSQYIESKKEKVKHLLILKEEYNQLQLKAEESNSRFFTDDEGDAFLKGLNTLVEKETRNNLIAVQPVSEEIISESLSGNTGRYYKRSDVKVVVAGQFSTIYDLIHHFFTSDKLLSVKEINIKIEKEEPLMLKADFILSIYILSGNKGS